MLRGYVYAKKVGKVLTVPKWIKMLYNVYQIAPVTVHLTSNFKHVLVNRDGLVKIVRKVNHHPESKVTILLILLQSCVI